MTAPPAQEAGDAPQQLHRESNESSCFGKEVVWLSLNNSAFLPLGKVPKQNGSCCTAARQTEWKVLSSLPPQTKNAFKLRLWHSISSRRSFAWCDAIGAKTEFDLLQHSWSFMQTWAALAVRMTTKMQYFWWSCYMFGEILDVAHLNKIELELRMSGSSSCFFYSGPSRWHISGHYIHGKMLTVHLKE